MPPSISIIGTGVNGLVCAYFIKTMYPHVLVDVYARTSAVDPQSASYGMHRLIHPWKNEVSSDYVESVSTALALWKKIFVKIGYDGFRKTGVYVQSENIPTAYSSIPNLRTNPAICSFRNNPSNDARKFNSLLFEEYGFILADKTLGALMDHLLAIGVRVHKDHELISVDSDKCELKFRGRDKVVTFDRLILAIGYGLGAVGFKGHYRPPITSIMRCFVGYLKLGLPSVNLKVSWATLEATDLWGMPEFNGLPCKLGCGEFTKKVDSTESNYTVSRSAFMRKYKKYIGIKSICDIDKISYNHWTLFSSRDFYNIQGKVLTLTSDSGGGFKLAPLVGLKVAETYRSTFD